MFVGRGAISAPPNRFESVWRKVDHEQLAADDDLLAGERKLATTFAPDKAESLIRENNSPDVPFRFSLNAYRGCEHGCSYCYARPYHEMLGFNAGIDFETQILVKYDAVPLLRKELNKPSWKPEMIVMSGVTDCYQPCERRFRLTRGLLEVLLEARQPIGIITKNALVLRDLDLLERMAALNLLHVGISITTLDAELARTMEPRTSTPQARLKAIAALAEHGVPARVMMSPLIPGLTDHEVPQILAAAKAAGAQGASSLLLRLPLAVAPIFMDWLKEHRPLAAEKVEGLIRGARDGKLNNSEFVSRMRGTGTYAEHLRTTFQLFKKKYDLDRPWPTLDASQFRPPRDASGQGLLF